MRDLLLVGVGGFLGAAARYALTSGVGTAFGHPRFPFATLAVNVLGCLLIGVFAALAERWPALDGATRLLVVTGVLGGFTTFSAFGMETVSLLRRGDMALAAIYVAASLLLGLGAVWLGLRIGAFAR